MDVIKTNMTTEEAIDQLLYIRDCLDMTFAIESERKQIIALTMAIEALRKRG